MQCKNASIYQKLVQCFYYATGAQRTSHKMVIVALNQWLSPTSVIAECLGNGLPGCVARPTLAVVFVISLPQHWKAFYHIKFFCNPLCSRPLALPWPWLQYLQNNRQNRLYSCSATTGQAKGLIIGVWPRRAGLGATQIEVAFDWLTRKPNLHSCYNRLQARLDYTTRLQVGGWRLAEFNEFDSCNRTTNRLYNREYVRLDFATGCTTGGTTGCIM